MTGRLALSASIPHQYRLTRSHLVVEHLSTYRLPIADLVAYSVEERTYGEHTLRFLFLRHRDARAFRYELATAISRVDVHSIIGDRLAEVPVPDEMNCTAFHRQQPPSDSRPAWGSRSS